MSLDHQRAQLLHAIAHAPQKVLVVGDQEGVLHQVLYTHWDGWVAGCGLDIRGVAINRMRYGRPDCLDCMAQDKPDHHGAERTDQKLKLVSQIRGQHIHTVMFVGNGNETMANIGGFTALSVEWAALRAALVLGCKALGVHIELEDVE